MVRVLCVSLLLFNFSSPLQAWDESGHRLTAEIAYTYLTNEIKQDLFEILAQHPRYQQDFIDAMPREIRRGTTRQREVWLFGRAAFWPDLARRLSRDEQEKYNRPIWHYIDGSLLRGNATIQGNTYIDIDPLPDKQDTPVTNNSSDDVTNILQSLDYNAAVLTNTSSRDEDKAIAMCWILHLIADIHQPLHTGSLFSALTFPTGDGGGNGVQANGRTLHLVWDRALTGLDYDETLQRVLIEIDQSSSDQLALELSDWTSWMQESRVILKSNAVYNRQIREAISVAEQERSNLVVVQLGEPYLAEMKRISLNRLADAGKRLAGWFNQNPAR